MAKFLADTAFSAGFAGKSQSWVGNMTSLGGDKLILGQGGLTLSEAVSWAHNVVPESKRRTLGRRIEVGGDTAANRPAWADSNINVENYDTFLAGAALTNYISDYFFHAVATASIMFAVAMATKATQEIGSTVFVSVDDARKTVTDWVKSRNPYEMNRLFLAFFKQATQFRYSMIEDKPYAWSCEAGFFKFDSGGIEWTKGGIPVFSIKDGALNGTRYSMKINNSTGVTWEAASIGYNRYSSDGRVIQNDSEKTGEVPDIGVAPSRRRAAR